MDVKASLAAGADPNAYAVPRYRAPALLRTVTRYYDPEDSPDDRWDLWDYDESPEAEPQYGRMPGKIAIIEALLDAGAEIDKRDQCGSTALFEAVRFCDCSVVQILLAGGADINLSYYWNSSVLKMAIWNRDADFVRMILESGADINARGASGETALLFAVRMMASGRRVAHADELFAALLDHGADVAIADNSGLSVMDHLPRGLLGTLVSWRWERQLLRAIRARQSKIR